ncbi:MAG: response regulator transcription factor [Synergistaceae bacterium]|jgi:DNA-binding response OmpR family regulator|nr:response regulator transcription factor [Synergistaceae bacterium]
MPGKKILIVEDDTSIAEIERDFLEINGMECVLVSNGTDGLREASSGRYDLILLDLMLPGLDGYEITKRIRGSVDTPILMVTAKTDDADKIRGLGLGADDYISKPFSPTELVARVKANLAQYERLTGRPAAQDGEITAGNIRINHRARRVYADEREIDLKNREYELLYFLASNPDAVFSKETLYDRVWGMDAAGDTATVAVHINRLREKIERDPSDPAHIETVWGVGYRFKK